MPLRLTRGLFTGLVEIGAVFDQLRTLGAHRRVLLPRVTLRHHDDDRQPGVTCRQRHALPVVATGGSDQSTHLRFLPQQPLHVKQTAAHLERTGRCMVLMLDPDLATQPLGQPWPGILSSGGHTGMHQTGSFTQGSQVEHGTPRQQWV
ncbi:hypothetical protein D9M71_647330 [compost metagenome]